MIRIKAKEIIELFDTRNNNLRHNISSIINLVGEDLGAALFKKYFEETYNKKVEIDHLSSPVSGTKKGPRLDRWIYIHDSKKIFVAYQTEIKNWSAYAIGGRPVEVNSNILDIGLKNWEERKEKLLEKERNGENKVFYSMKSPKKISNYSKVKIEPLLIYWMALSKNGKSSNPFFSFALPKKINGFRKLNVFSMSNYLRYLLNSKKNLEFNLDMINAENRISLCQRYFSISKKSIWIS